MKRGAAMTTIALTPGDEEQVEVFAGRLFDACLATMELANVELGIRLGLYESLAGAGPVTAAELAERSGIARRYAREWLEQQAVAGVVDVDDATKAPDERRFELPNAHAHVLLDDDSEACMKPCAAVVPWLAKAIDIMVEEFRQGTGAAFGLFDLHDVQAAFTRPVFVNHLTQNWLPALPEVQHKLDSGAPVRIAEVGCGEGLAAITIARAVHERGSRRLRPRRRVDRRGPAAAAAAGVADRARFELRDAADPTITGDYDLVMAIEMLHDVPDPVGILRTMKTLAGKAGTVLVVDERTEDDVHRADQRDGALLLLVQHPALPRGEHAGWRRGHRDGDPTRHGSRLRDRAGFSTIETLDVEHPQFVLYRLT